MCNKYNEWKHYISLHELKIIMKIGKGDVELEERRWVGGEGE